MKRFVVVALVAAAMALLPTAAAANGGSGSNGKFFGPYSSGSGDSGTCGPDWANDTYKREFFVQQTSGTWHVTEAFLDGRFSTLLGPSPGACETSNPHGLLVAADKKGNFGGFETGTVSAGTYNPNGCNPPADCSSSTTAFIHAVFGPTGVYNVTTFYFDYRARDQGLIYGHWVNASTDLGGNRGDIATT